MRKGFWKGLRLIEISIIWALIIVAISIVYVRYDAFMCRSIESEAKFSLEQIYAAQMLYHKEHDHFASMETLVNKEQRVLIPQKYYVFSDKFPPQQDHFCIQAFGRKKTLVSGQIWQIDEAQELLNIESRCGYE
ncbi:MAG: hypothetical protein KC505_05570 [Myxococcales bacterium]|nr:hypothetical protein [Myxococcales bacterium]USN51436.1 MAG: hypothetical protein H6731_03240 [Myxococcales bacterium]